MLLSLSVCSHASIEGSRIFKVSGECASSAEAKRLLTSIKDDGVAKILRKRCALIDTIQELVQTKDLRTIEPEELQKRYHFLKLDPEGSTIEPTDSLKLKVLVTAVSAHAKKMVESEAEKDVQDFLRMIVPFSENCKGFDYFAPTMMDTVLEALARIDQDSGGWNMLAKEELQDLPEPTPINWEDGYCYSASVRSKLWSS